MSFPPVGAELFVLALTEEWSHEAERKCWIFPRSPGQCHSVLHQSHRVLVRTDLTFFTFILIRDNFASATLIWGQMIPNSKKKTNPVTHFLLYFSPITADFCAFTAPKVLLGFKMTQEQGEQTCRKMNYLGWTTRNSHRGCLPSKYSSRCCKYLSALMQKEWTPKILAALRLFFLL